MQQGELHSQELIENFMRVYNFFPLPTIIVGTDYSFCAGNEMAQALYPTLCTPSRIAVLLAEHAMENLRERMKQCGVCTLTGAFPFSDKLVSLLPVWQGEAMDAMILQIFSADAAPQKHDAYLSSQCISSLSQTLRESVSNVFGEMDAVSLQADLFVSGWMKPRLDSMCANSYRILRIAQNICVYCNYITGAMEPNFCALDLTDLLENLGECISAIGERMGIPVAFSLPSTPCFVKADRSMLELAIFNLVHNSLFFTREHNRIDVSLELEKGDARILVQDHGVGIPSEVLPCVWRPYFPYDHNRQGAGIGLGLALVKMVMQAHAGSCAVDSTLGEGACVELRLPFSRPSEPLSFRESDREDVCAQYLSDRFSPLYTGLADAVESPYREEET